MFYTHMAHSDPHLTPSISANYDFVCACIVTGTMRLRAARDIPAGEQLFIAYLDVDLPVARRQEKLHFGYGFHCTCARCLEEM